jgi:hypothetical protein
MFVIQDAYFFIVAAPLCLVCSAQEARRNLCALVGRKISIFNQTPGAPFLCLSSVDMLSLRSSAHYPICVTIHHFHYFVARAA